MTTMIGHHGKVHRATEDHALLDQTWFCLNYCPTLAALTEPHEQIPQAQR